MSTTSGSVSPPLPSEAEAAPTSSAGTVPLAAGAAVAAEAVLGSTGAAGAAEAVEAAVSPGEALGRGEQHLLLLQRQ